MTEEIGLSRYQSECHKCKKIDWLKYSSPVGEICDKCNYRYYTKDGIREARLEEFLKNNSPKKKWWKFKKI